MNITPPRFFQQEMPIPGRVRQKTTIYCANIAAGFMIGHFTKYLRNIALDYDIQLNLLSYKLSSVEM